MTVEFRHINRREGKTHMLIEEMIKEPRAVMIVASHRRARFAIDMMVEQLEKRDGKRVTKLQRHGLESRFFSISSWHEQRRGIVPLDAPIYIDDIDDVLVTLLGNVELCTTSAPFSTYNPVDTTTTEESR